jgi:hypothetical protein
MSTAGDMMHLQNQGESIPSLLGWPRDSLHVLSLGCLFQSSKDASSSSSRRCSASSTSLLFLISTAITSLKNMGAIHSMKPRMDTREFCGTMSIRFGLHPVSWTNVSFLRTMAAERIVRAFFPLRVKTLVNKSRLSFGYNGFIRSF